jgi:hypothetical protein
MERIGNQSLFDGISARIHIELQTEATDQTANSIAGNDLDKKEGGINYQEGNDPLFSPELHYTMR